MSESRYGFTVGLTEGESDADSFSVGCGVRQVLEFERRVSVGEEQRTWALKADFGEYSLLGIPGAEACSVWGFNKEEPRTIISGECQSEEVSSLRER